MKGQKLFLLLMPSFIELIIIFFLSFHLKYPMESGYLLWQHVTLGGMDIKSGKIVTQDPFSYLPSRPLKRTSWLSDDLFYLLFSVGKYRAIIIAKILILIFLFLAPFYLFKCDPVLYTLILPLYVVLILPGTALRPALFALVLFLMFIYALYREHTMLMAVLVFLWSLLHGSYIIGMILFFAYTVKNLKKLLNNSIRFIGAFIIVLIPAFLPHSSISLFGKLAGQGFLFMGFEEWLPVKITSFVGIAFLLYIVLWFYFVSKNKRWSYAVYGIIVLILAIRFRRFIPFFAIIGFPEIVYIKNAIPDRHSFRVFLRDSMRFPLWIAIFFVYFVSHAPGFTTYFVKDYHPYQCISPLKSLKRGSKILTLQAWVPYLYFESRGEYLFAIDGLLAQPDSLIKTYLKFLEFKGRCKDELYLLSPEYVLLPSVFRENTGKFCEGCLKIEHISSTCVIWKNLCKKQVKMP